MNKVQEISDYRVLGYSNKDLNEVKDREIAIKAKSKKEIIEILKIVTKYPNIKLI